jgi:hypothetical protein
VYITAALRTPWSCSIGICSCLLEAWASIGAMLFCFGVFAPAGVTRAGEVDIWKFWPVTLQNLCLLIYCRISSTQDFKCSGFEIRVKFWNVTSRDDNRKVPKKVFGLRLEYEGHLAIHSTAHALYLGKNLLLFIAFSNSFILTCSVVKYRISFRFYLLTYSATSVVLGLKQSLFKTGFLH